MKIILICFFAVLAVFAFVLLILHVKTLRPVRSMLIHAALGLLFTAVINLTSRFTGIAIPINPYTLCSVSVLGVPAVCGILVLNLIL